MERKTSGHIENALMLSFNESILLGSLNKMESLKTISIINQNYIYSKLKILFFFNKKCIKIVKEWLDESICAATWEHIRHECMPIANVYNGCPPSKSWLNSGFWASGICGRAMLIIIIFELANNIMNLKY
jgi:hypothetical protein